MNFKCSYCDPVVSRGSGSKKGSIDSDIDEYVKDDNDKYFHNNCFKEYWKNRKRISIRKSDEEIESLICKYKEKQVADLKEMEEKDKFLTWIMEYYDGTLSTYYLRKLQSIRDGKYDGVSEPIDYFTLHDIYNYMKGYLNKVAMKKHFDSIGLRMNYDLAIVVGNIGDYKRFIEKQKRSTVEDTIIDKQVDRDKKSAVANENRVKKETFDITDIMDDLLI